MASPADHAPARIEPIRAPFQDFEVDAVHGDDVAVELPQSFESNVRVGRRLR